MKTDEVKMKTEKKNQKKDLETKSLLMQKSNVVRRFRTQATEDLEVV